MVWRLYTRMLAKHPCELLVDPDYSSTSSFFSPLSLLLSLTSDGRASFHDSDVTRSFVAAGMMGGGDIINQRLFEKTKPHEVSRA